MVNPERGDQGLSSVSPGKNSKTFLGTDRSRTTTPFPRGNSAYRYKADLIFLKNDGLSHRMEGTAVDVCPATPHLALPHPQQNVSLKFSPISTNN